MAQSAADNCRARSVCQLQGNKGREKGEARRGPDRVEEMDRAYPTA